MSSTRVAFITGVSDGIGAEVARQLAAGGARVLGVGRRAAPAVDDLAIDANDYLQLDLADEDRVERVLAFLTEREVSKLDDVILNAAVAAHGSIVEQDPDELQRLVTINLEASLSLAHGLFGHLQRAGGHLTLVSSLAVAFPCPDFAVYTATKSALDGFARTLNVEWRGKVTVRVVHPGATRTAMHDKIGFDPKRSAQFAAPQQVARSLLKSLRSARRSVRLGVAQRIFYRAYRSLERLGDGVARSIGKRRVLTGDEELPAAHASEARRVLITGGGSGIGAALCDYFLKRGARVTAIDRSHGDRWSVRNGETLESDDDDRAELRERCVVHSFDLTDSTARTSFLDAAEPWDIVIHCAGISSVGPFEQISWEQQRAVIDINFTVPMELTRALLLKKLVRQRGHIVFVSSLSRFVSYPGAATYAATKEGLCSYARSLGVAVAPHGIHVMTAYPGPTRTPHAARYSPEGSSASKRMLPQYVARCIATGIRRRQSSVIPGAGNQVAAILGMWLPRIVEGVLRRELYERLAVKKV